MTELAHSSGNNTKLTRLLGAALTVSGCFLFALYLLYLPFPHVFDVGVITDTGLALYGLASAGCALVAWGNILVSLNGASVKQSAILKASAWGFLMLGFMRVGTAVFPHAPFDDLRVVAIIECILFIVIAFKLFRSAQ